MTDQTALQTNYRSMMLDQVAMQELRVADLRRLLAEYRKAGKGHLVPLISILVEDATQELLEQQAVTAAAG